MLLFYYFSTVLFHYLLFYYLLLYFLFLYYILPRSQPFASQKDLQIQSVKDGIYLACYSTDDASVYILTELPLTLWFNTAL